MQVEFNFTGPLMMSSYALATIMVFYNQSILVKSEHFKFLGDNFFIVSTKSLKIKHRNYSN